MQNEDHKREIGTRLMLILIISHISAALIGLFVGYQWNNIDLLPRALLGGLVGGALGALVMLPVLHSLSVIGTTLRRLSAGDDVSELPVRRRDPLAKLTDTVNRLAARYQEVGQMRGQLYRQISEAAAQEERNRLARDLHDSIKQQVFSMSISAAAAQAHLDRDVNAARAALIDVKQSAQEAMVEMRALLQQLSPAPLEKVGLVQALRDQCEALAYRTGALVEPHIGDLPPDDRLPPGAQETLFRIAQEALSNIARHARAHRVTLTFGLQDDQSLVLRIVDDGQGFSADSAAGGMGLNNMKQRAASLRAALHIDSTPGQGTRLETVIPLANTTGLSEKEAHMRAQHESQFKVVQKAYYIFGTAVAAFILSSGLLIWRLIERPESIATDAILTILLILFAGIALVSLPLAVINGLKAQRGVTELLVSAGAESPIFLKMRRHRHMAFIIIGISIFWFAPILLTASVFPAWAAPVMAVIGLAWIFWNYWRMYRVYHAELDMMTQNEQLAELDLRMREVRTAWFSLGSLFLVILVTGTFADGIHLVPRNPDQWMSTVIQTTAAMLLANQFIQIWDFRRSKARLVKQS